MKQLIIHIVTFLAIGHFATATSFDLADYKNNGDKYMLISFTEPSTIFGYETNYVIGAFVKREKSLLCIGIANSGLKKPVTLDNMVIHGRGIEDDGAIEGEEIIFIAISISQGPPNCEIIIYPTIDGKKEKVIYEANTKKEFEGWVTHDIIFDYPLSVICTSSNQVITPTVDLPNIPSYVLAKYTSISPDVLLNHSTGDIDPKQSLAGNYTITLDLTTDTVRGDWYVDKYCIQQPSVNIRLTGTQESFEIDDYILENTPQLCDQQKGLLILNSKEFPFENASLQIEIGNESQIYSFQEKYEFEEGHYFIKNVIDQYGCQYAVDYAFSIEKEGDCEESYVLMPFTNNAPSKITFKQEGEIKVVDKNGVVIKTLIAPVTWDGTTEDGSFVDIGVYFIYNNDEFVKNLHVYR